MYLLFLVDASTIYFVTPTGWGGAIHISPFNSQEDTIKDHLTARIGGRLVFQLCKFRNVISYSFLKYNILKSNFRFNHSIIAVPCKGSLNHTKTQQNIRRHSAGCCSTRFIASATLWVMVIVSDLKFFSSLSRFPEKHNSFLGHHLRL